MTKKGKFPVWPNPMNEPPPEGTGTVVEAISQTSAPAIPLGPVVTLVIALEDLVEDSDNVRKEFDLDSLDSLGASMVLLGQLEPIGVRPLKAGGQVVPGKWIIIWGHRRFRAALRTKGKITALRAEVRDAGEHQVPALQLAENDQREALKYLERSNKHQQMRARGLTTAQIAEQTTTKEATIRDSLKLQALVPEVKKAWVSKELDYSHALEFARVAPKVQPALLKRLREIAEEQEDECTVRQLRHVARTEFMLDLAKAPFPIADAQLVPSAGACTNCPKRTGAQMELGDNAKTPDLCTDKPCHGSKVDAFLAQQERAGRRVLNEGTAKQIFSEHSNSDRPQYNSTYVLASEMATAKKTYAQLVDPKNVALVLNPTTGNLLEVISKSALPASREQGGGRSEPRTKDPGEIRRERENKARSAAQLAILDEMARSDDTKNGTDLFLRAVALGLVQSVQSEPVKQLCRRLGLEPKPGDDYRDLLWEQQIDTLGSVQLRRVVLQLAYADQVQPFSYSSGMNQHLLAGAKMLRVDVKKVEAAARKELAEELKEKAAAKKKPAGKKGKAA